MAQILKDTDFAVARGHGRSAAKYKEYLDGQRRLVKQGVDFNCQRNAFCARMRDFAKANGGHMVGQTAGIAADEWIFYFVPGKRSDEVAAPVVAEKPKRKARKVKAETQIAAEQPVDVATDVLAELGLEG